MRDAFNHNGKCNVNRHNNRRDSYNLFAITYSLSLQRWLQHERLSVEEYGTHVSCMGPSLWPKCYRRDKLFPDPGYNLVAIVNGCIVIHCSRADLRMSSGIFDRIRHNHRELRSRGLLLPFVCAYPRLEPRGPACRGKRLTDSQSIHPPIHPAERGRSLSFPVYIDALRGSDAVMVYRHGFWVEPFHNDRVYLARNYVRRAGQWL